MLNFCKVDWCDDECLPNSALCQRHDYQNKNEGIRRTIFDKNDIILKGRVCIIVIRDKYCNVVANAEVDIEDFELIRDYKWYKNKVSSYLYSDSIRSKRVMLHRLIAGAKGKQKVDHIDFNPLNNKRSNLRICSNAENVWHQRPLEGSSSIYKGVSFYKPSKKWRARIKANGKYMHIGHFENEIDAAKAYNIYAEKYHNDFCFLNEVGA